jgi:hypothetical protein
VNTTCTEGDAGQANDDDISNNRDESDSITGGEESNSIALSSSPLPHKTAKAVVLLDSATGEVVREFQSQKIASLELNVNQTAISLCVNRKQPTAGGHLVRFKADLPYPMANTDINSSKRVAAPDKDKPKFGQSLRADYEPGASSASSSSETSVKGASGVGGGSGGSSGTGIGSSGGSSSSSSSTGGSGNIGVTHRLLGGLLGFKPPPLLLAAPPLASQQDANPVATIKKTGSAEETHDDDDDNDNDLGEVPKKRARVGAFDSSSSSSSSVIPSWLVDLAYGQQSDDSVAANSINSMKLPPNTAAAAAEMQDDQGEDARICGDSGIDAEEKSRVGTAAVAVTRAKRQHPRALELMMYMCEGDHQARHNNTSPSAMMMMAATTGERASATTASATAVTVVAAKNHGVLEVDGGGQNSGGGGGDEVHQETAATNGLLPAASDPADSLREGGATTTHSSLMMVSTKQQEQQQHEMTAKEPRAELACVWSLGSRNAFYLPANASTALAGEEVSDFDRNFDAATVQRLFFSPSSPSPSSSPSSSSTSSSSSIFWSPPLPSLVQQKKVAAGSTFQFDAIVEHVRTRISFDSFETCVCVCLFVFF